MTCHVSLSRHGAVKQTTMQQPSKQPALRVTHTQAEETHNLVHCYRDELQPVDCTAAQGTCIMWGLRQYLNSSCSCLACVGNLVAEAVMAKRPFSARAFSAASCVQHNTQISMRGHHVGSACGISMWGQHNKRKNELKYC